MTKPFFLTRQTANLMEDFVRELKQGSALFLLYGDPGVGKTRLLHELGQSRLAERAIFWLDLDSTNGSDETRIDRSAEVEALFAAAGNGDIIIADHFEMALKKTRHQLFLSWSTDGIDKHLNLIIASSTDGFNELRQLSQQYGVRVQSFQQMPFDNDEVQAFLGFYLFPDQPVGKLTIPAPLRKQIGSAGGLVGRLIEIADRDGEQVRSEPVVEQESIRQGSRLIAYLLVLVVLAAGVGWYLIREPALLEPPPITLNLPRQETQNATPANADPISDLAEPADEAAQALATEDDTPTVADTGISVEAPERQSAGQIEPVVGTVVAAEMESEAATVQEPPLAASTAAEVKPAAESGEASAPAVAGSEAGSSAQEPPQAGPDNAAPTAATDEIEAGVVPESEAVIVSTEPASADQDVAQQSRSGAPLTAEQRFQAELQQSMDWISARDDSVGTIQILLLSHANFDADNYYQYVNDLAAREVDVDRLHVFKTLTGKREVYSVVYGEYASRNSAFGAIDSLPAVLRNTSPLARSVGGLWQEIRRLESKN